MSSTLNTISKPEFQSTTSISDLIGEWGTWQRRTVLLIFLCKIPAAWFMACIIFTAPFAQYGEYNCQTPNANTNHSHWIEMAHPLNGNEYDFCNVYENVSNLNSNIVPCDTFEHHSIFNSLVTQFDLVCSRKILIAVTQFSHLCGVLFGGITATKLLES